METKTIRCSNVKEKEGQYGPSLQIGEKVGEEWTNYFANDEALFSYFTKGASVTIEYEKKGNWNVIKGVSSAANVTAGGGSSGGSAPVSDSGRQKSIELQTVTKACAELLAGKDLAAGEFTAYIKNVWTDVFGDPLEAMKKKAQEALGAVEEDDGEGFPF